MVEFPLTQPSQAVTGVIENGGGVCQFLSTLPSQAVTSNYIQNNKGDCISIHTAFAGSDVTDDAIGANLIDISIHTAFAGSDVISSILSNVSRISIHTAFAGSDQ